jgi:hypothetical protein
MSSAKSLNFCLAFWEADFHNIKDREALSRSHNSLNTTDKLDWEFLLIN